VSAQTICTITPINSTILTAAGGVLADGTQNVMFGCSCMRNGDRRLKSPRWFNSKGDRLVSKDHPSKYVPGVPYIEKTYQDRYTALIIPIFNQSYDGVYICGIGNLYPPGIPNATVNLSLRSK